jgi:hypothetical protein
MADKLPFHLRGTLQIMKASDLYIIPSIQRKASDDRLRKLAAAWDEHKVGTLEVAHITDTEYKGRFHPTDGGTRKSAQTEYGDPDYLFLCVVKPMTYVEAAQDFLAKNGLSMSPSAFARYAVGIQAGVDEALAVQTALKNLGLSGSPARSTYGNGVEGTFAAFAAAERIVKANYKVTSDWGEASRHFVWSLDTGRKAYPQHGDEATAIGHDADIIQAISVLGALNPKLVTDEAPRLNFIHAITTWLGESAAKTRLFETGQLMTPSHWKVCTMAATKNTGGSSSRGSQMARQIALNHLQKFGDLKKPDAPK